MRPVNLIPSDQRRDGATVRTGPVAYLIVGALALGLVAVIMVVLTNNKIADRRHQIAELQQQQAAVQSRVAALKPFIDFNQSEQQRVDEIRQLANSRFDWNRVMRELSRVIPADVSLTSLDASAIGDPGAAGDTSATTDTTAGSPSLTFAGCATSQEAVAGFIAALQDIDGVTGVDLESSQTGSGSGAAASGAGSSGSSSADCGRNVSFGLTANFDGATPDASSGVSTATATTSGGSTVAPATDTSAPAAGS